MMAISRPSESAHSADSLRRNMRPTVSNAARCLDELNSLLANSLANSDEC